MKRHRLLVCLPCVVCAFLLLVVLTVWFNLRHEIPAQRHHNSRRNQMSGPLEAIVVPGGGSQRGESSRTLPLAVRRRLDLALQRWYEHVERWPDAPKPFIMVLSAGTVHRPNFINAAGWPVSEATSEAQYLVEVSSQDFPGKPPLPPQLILRENISLDTIGNAYFLRTMHTDVMGITRLHCITSAFHMPRTRAIFEFVFALPSLGRSALPTAYDLTFEDASDENVYETEALMGRYRRERQSLIGFRKTLEGRFHLQLDGVMPSMIPNDPIAMSLKEIDVIDVGSWNIAAAVQRSGASSAGSPPVSLADVHRWLFTDHSAYATGLSMIRRDAVDSATLETY